MIVKRERAKTEHSEIDGARIRLGPSGQNLRDDKINPAHLAFRPLPGARDFPDQPASREPSLAWRVSASLLGTQQSAGDRRSGRPSRDLPTAREPGVAASGSSAQQPARDDGIAPVRRRHSQGILLSVVFAVGIVTGAWITAPTLTPGLGQSVRSLVAAAWGVVSDDWGSSRRGGEGNGGASIESAQAPVAHPAGPANSTANEPSGDPRPHRDVSEQPAAQQSLEAPQSAAVPTIAANGGAAALSTQDAEEGDPAQSEATSSSAPLQMPTTSGRAAASVLEEPAEPDHPNVNAWPSAPEESAARLPVPPRPAPAQGDQPASNEARVRQAFEQFLNERQQAPSGLQDRQALFIEFKNSLANRLPGAAAPTSASKEGTPRVEIWQALDTTNIRELASSLSTVIGTVEKGSTFRVIDRSKDGKWLKIETRDGSTGYYWAARARETR